MALVTSTFTATVISDRDALHLNKQIIRNFRMYSLCAAYTRIQSLWIIFQLRTLSIWALLRPLTFEVTINHHFQKWIWKPTDESEILKYMVTLSKFPKSNSNCNMNMNCLGIRFNADSDSVGLRFCISNKILDDIKYVGPWTSLLMRP